MSSYIIYSQIFILFKIRQNQLSISTNLREGKHRHNIAKNYQQVSIPTIFLDTMENASSQMRRTIYDISNKKKKKYVVNNNKKSQSQMHPGLSHTSRMECFVTIVIDF